MFYKVSILLFCLILVKCNNCQSQDNSILYLQCYYKILQLDKPDSLILKNKVKEVNIYKVNYWNKSQLLVTKKYNKNGLLEKRVEYYAGAKSDSLVYFIDRLNKNSIRVQIILGENAINEVDDDWFDDDIYYGFKNWKRFAFILTPSRIYKKDTIDIQYRLDNYLNYTVLTYINKLLFDSTYWEIGCCPDTSIKVSKDTSFSKDTMIVRTAVPIDTTLGTYQEYYLNNLLVKHELYIHYNTLSNMQTYNYDKKNRLIEYFSYKHSYGKFIKDTSEQIKYNDSAGTRTEIDSVWYTFPSSIDYISTRSFDSSNHLVESEIHSYHDTAYDDPHMPKETISQYETIYNKEGLCVSEVRFLNDFLKNTRRYEYKFW